MASRPPRRRSTARRRPTRKRGAGSLAIARQQWSRLPARTRRLAAAGTVVVALGLIAYLAFGRGSSHSGGSADVPPPQPEGTGLLRYDPAREASMDAAAASGLAHVVYMRSPGGVIATAQRVLAYEDTTKEATKGTGIDPQTVLAIIFLESAGRPDVIAGSDPASAAGLGQILASTATDFLGMHVDLARSRRLTTEIATAGDTASLEAQRRGVDDRFDPAKAIRGIVRYLQLAGRTFGRDDLAIESYHMGIGNLTSVLADFSGTTLGPETVAAEVRKADLSWTRVYFASSPVSHPAAWKRLQTFSDDSLNYAWKVGACRAIIAAYRSDPASLARLATLQTSRDSAELALHPPATTPRFTSTAQLLAAWDKRELVPLVSGKLYRVDAQMGALAERFKLPRTRFRGLRPRALATLRELSQLSARVSGDHAPLVVTSSVRDDSYQALLRGTNIEAAKGVSEHTTGYSFDFSRAYHSSAQAHGVQFALDRMQALDLIAWVREPTAIHVTVR